jgi:4,5-DOPA dioxygenase extradiol
MFVFINFTSTLRFASMKKNLLNNIISSGIRTVPMPVLFIGHGSPMNAIEENEFSSSWQNIAKLIPLPKAVLCISAHWETNGTFVTAMQKPKTIHDFGGFPQELFSVMYPAPGDPALAADIKKSVSYTKVGLDEKWGLDHGAWSVIKHMYPLADIPVLEMSLDYYKAPQYHYELARELTALRKNGVLIIGSGNMVHNLGSLAWDHASDQEYGFDWAIQSNETFKKLILSGNHKDLINYNDLGREVQMAVPTPDHYLPLLYALALKEENEPVNVFNDKAIMGSLTMTSLKIG